MSNDTPILPGLSPVDGLEIHARFDGGAMSSNGGALLLRQAGRARKLSTLLASCITDARDPARVVHSYASMVQARMVAIACGHEDCDDLDALRHDPALKMACDKRPDADIGLASQPTLSRLENALNWRMLARMGLSLIDAFCGSYARVPSQIVLDIDDTVDRVHGGQQLSLFSTHAGNTCFQPILIFEAGTEKPVAALLRPGKRPSGEEAANVLRHVIRRIRSNWPRVEILLRGDGHYGTPEVMNVLEDMGCSYVFGLPTNARLKAIAMPWTEDAATRRALRDRDCVRRFYQTNYAARSWRCERRVIACIEARRGVGVETRFIVTNIPGGRAKHLYEKLYCARGRMENMIKEHKRHLASDRTSCHRWEANQFRLFLHTAAYWLMLDLRAAAPRKSRWRTATFKTIRTIFLKIAARIEALRTRIRVSFPSATQNKPVIAHMLSAMEARAP